MKSNKRLRGRPNGFTLAEIMLVVAILGILVGVVVPRLTGRTKEARQQAARLQVENISMALDAFEYDCGRYPTTQEGLEALRQAPPGVRNWKGPYLKKAVPTDPWSNAYGYSSPGTKNPDFDLRSSGPDGQEGNDDDLGNW
jgi:general secretion pathway protein G